MTSSIRGRLARFMAFWCLGAASQVQAEAQVTDSQQYLQHQDVWQVQIHSMTPKVLNCTISWTANWSSGGAASGNPGILVPAYPGYGSAINSHWESPQHLRNFNHTVMCR